MAKAKVALAAVGLAVAGCAATVRLETPQRRHFDAIVADCYDARGYPRVDLSDEDAWDCAVRWEDYERVWGHRWGS